MKPRIAIIPGDPSGIGPEICAKLLNQKNVQSETNIVLVGDTHLWEQGAKQAQTNIKLNTVNENQIEKNTGIVHLNMDTINQNEVVVAKETKAGGATSLRCLDKALDLAMENIIDGILFAPFNKAAMTSAGLNVEDEHKYIAQYIGWEKYHSEINVLDEFMTTRVTSHIPLKDVAKHINEDAIVNAVILAEKTLIKAGKKRPNIAVAALNPHAGDNGKFGREEIEIIQPAVQKCKERQINVSGPWSPDTVFLKATKKEVDAIVTMYHDQGQIAVKLLGFERGATIAGGLPIPVVTPAHGTAFDIAGKNKANVGAMMQAFDLLVQMAKTHKDNQEK